ELGWPPLSGIFALGASIQMMQSIGIKNIETRALALNRLLTDRLKETGWRVLSPLREGSMRSGETLVQAENPDEVVAALAGGKNFVYRKTQRIRVSICFFQ